MSVKITPVLGVVAVVSGAELVDKPRPAANSTRWMFDVEGAADEDIVIQLVDSHGRKAQPDLMACSFQAYSAAFYDAKPFSVPAEQVSGVITIRHGGMIPNTDGEAPRPTKGIACKYRVMIDVLHTATR